MTYRSDVQPETFVDNSRVVTETLAYSLATEEQQILLTDIFESVARRIELLFQIQRSRSVSGGLC